LLAAIADRECKKLAQQIIQHLEEMTDCLLSGDDSGLKTVWDEVCIQVQGQDSPMWDAYVETIEDIVLGFVDDLNPEMKEAIWLQTREGEDWEPRHDEARIPSLDEDIARYVLDDYVLKAAGDWTNPRIEKFRE